MKVYHLLLYAIIFSFTASAQLNFPPTPNEDIVKGKNDNCYLSAINHPTAIEKEQFINSIKHFVDSISAKEKLPGKVILAMAILESGYGFTRTAYYANNLFGIKVFTRDTLKTYVLKGQPSEGVVNKVIKKIAENRVLYDETARVDNRYRVFKDRRECILYLINKLLLGNRYISVTKKFQENIRTNALSEREASLTFAFDLAEKGYNHLGGKHYRKEIEKIINALNL